ncbi:hypothetical protein RRG08_008098 [Elysia crispata]|uniref:Uncharacterized protein n=1 Tax=Elysia crispata TaxID=231223 RepID=A0AAE0YAW7_9GAST|nr:hypothetical protein RRG08_008098 [Elysia crispata]
MGDKSCHKDTIADNMSKAWKSYELQVDTVYNYRLADASPSNPSDKLRLMPRCSLPEIQMSEFRAANSTGSTCHGHYHSNFLRSQLPASHGFSRRLDPTADDILPVRQSSREGGRPHARHNLLLDPEFRSK